MMHDLNRQQLGSLIILAPLGLIALILMVYFSQFSYCAFETLFAKSPQVNVFPSDEIKSKERETVKLNQYLILNHLFTGNLPDKVNEADLNLDPEFKKQYQVMKELHTLPIEYLFYDETLHNVKNLMFYAVGADKIDPASRGHFVNAKELHYLEYLSQSPFMQLKAFPNPAPYASTDLKKAFDMALNGHYSLFILKGWAAGYLVKIKIKEILL